MDKDTYSKILENSSQKLNNIYYNIEEFRKMKYDGQVSADSLVSSLTFVSSGYADSESNSDRDISSSENRESEYTDPMCSLEDLMCDIRNKNMKNKKIATAVSTMSERHSDFSKNNRHLSERHSDFTKNNRHLSDVLLNNNATSLDSFSDILKNNRQLSDVLQNNDVTSLDSFFTDDGSSVQTANSKTANQNLITLYERMVADLNTEIYQLRKHNLTSNAILRNEIKQLKDDVKNLREDLLVKNNFIKHVLNSPGNDVTKKTNTKWRIGYLIDTFHKYTDEMVVRRKTTGGQRKR